MKVRQVYASWPEMAEDGLGASPEVDRGSFKKVYLLGMGGSAAAGDILSGWLYSCHGIEAEVCKGTMASRDMADCFAVACSASGNTKETIAMMKTALDRHATLVSISHGGRLAAVSKSRGIPHVQMPKIVAPRYMLPFMVFGTLRILDAALGLGSMVEAREAVSEMRRLRGLIDAKVPLKRNRSKQLALALLKRTPVIYGTRTTRGAGIRFKNGINENSKRHAVYDEMPELFHNEVQSWEEPGGRFVPILLRDSAETKKESRLADAFSEVLLTTGNDPLTVKGSGDYLLSRLMTMVYELDLASYYVAVGNGRDPFPVPLITKLKQPAG